ncbi:putative tyrosine-protein phosphatase auxilin [Cynara cardunculus var. scolymus]|uniref:putative tyrosine-protein phosphatase auxilin n=1 Tax=Cynara cardunculus var. scolymus TaxID=59895 RepID=UPI000D624673|nr:putative tyrosine-protein phosphatase auxilin [Cynara cardunculus var. scolymus]
MDQFGVLVESIGFKAHGKSSAPLADLKGTNKTNDNTNGLNVEFSSFSRSKSPYNSNPPLNVDDLDGIFRSDSSKDRKPPNSGFDDVFGGAGSGVNGIDLDSVFKVSHSNNYDDDDDVFGLNKRTSGSTSVDYYHTLNKTNPIDDLLGNFGGMGMASNGSRNNFGGKQANASQYDDLLGNSNGNGMKSNGLKKNSVRKQEAASESADLLSGFGIKPPSSNGRKSVTNPSRQSSGHSANLFSNLGEDPFVMMERAYGSSKANNGASSVDYLDSFFSSSTRPSQSSTSEDSVYDALFNNNGGPKAEKKSFSESSYGTQKASSKANGGDDFSYLFGMGDAPTAGEFQEMKGESEERRRARLNHHMTTRERMAKALNEKNKRDLQAQREQDEKLRVAATLDGDIKRWAVGKEGNLRALLSSLQQVLWSGSGWQPISLTDLITSTAVKKAYYKATLCIHPDKVQQKGATVQQKYIAEKVFDLLKEAWNKFNAEEFKKQ